MLLSNCLWILVTSVIPRNECPPRSKKLSLTPTFSTFNTLPLPEAGLQTGIDYVAPRTKPEEQLVHIWKEVLKVEKVGVKDNFFDLGGHSLRGMTLVTLPSILLSRCEPAALPVLSLEQHSQSRSASLLQAAVTRCDSLFHWRLTAFAPAASSMKEPCSLVFDRRVFL